MLNKRKKRKLLTEEEIQEKFKDVEFEKNDTTAMIIAAIVTLLPALLLVLGLIYGLLWLIFIG
ncbi:hypothetical protein PT250_01795 [Erysipelothrix rhusiopathiae]|uniref:Uncharacterized protein n=2 Tax=Erysipelothrix TaxID=1647 RepID=E7FTN5_ERYRH|nr:MULTISPECIES: hypothetical protein [Erysipelothrix]CAH2761586.1 hypothetical protein [Erysipelothrix sp. A18Y020d]AGN23678.1 hypothetical protein K210_00185 [Erysipelothrix rhusiopathiae SY1027]AMS11543.1 hypothetical protein A2I91_07255 [Erysipelothrix rhusiopathiae]AOO68042.1 hypothetical protein BC346_06775 [Erysipelothrix rhusiopathiae]AWU41110.1 hypothetical protein DM789_02340 [Erysipelothrix rhusiopathiae]